MKICIKLSAVYPANTWHHTGLCINASLLKIPIPKALHQHISKMTYYSLAVYFHIFTFSFDSCLRVFTKHLIKMEFGAGDYRGSGAVCHYQRGEQVSFNGCAVLGGSYDYPPSLRICYSWSCCDARCARCATVVH